MTPPAQTTFDGLGIAPKLLEILDKNKFTTPTPIQHQAIPVAIQGTDVMGIAQTGTGKTLAFGIPMLQRLALHKGRGLVLLPTRELAVQVDESLNKIGRPLGLKTAILIGGENMNKQIRQLKNNPHVIIATPGRLIDHLEQKTVRLDSVSILVLDEADRMLDMGFAPQIKKILQAVPPKRQTMLFSATMPEEIIRLANSYMQLPVRVEVAPPGTSAQSVTQELFFVQKQDKPQLLLTLLGEYKGTVLVFTRTKFGAKKIAAQVRRAGHASAEIHSNRSLNQRLEALQGFKMGKYRVLVATDIAARGIDVTGIELVVNFDLPAQAEDYVHRIGRTGRAAHTGHAISFATPDQTYDVRAIERLIKKQLPVSPLPALRAAAETGPQTESFKPNREDRRPGGQRRPNPRSSGHTGHERRGREHGMSKFQRQHRSEPQHRSRRNDRQSEQKNNGESPDWHKQITSGDPRSGFFMKPRPRPPRRGTPYVDRFSDDSQF